MAIKYQVIGCSNPAGEEGVDYACCRAVIPDKVTFVDLAQEVEHATSATKADVVGVLTSFKEFVRKALLNGQHVNLEGFGILKPSLKGRCFRQQTMTRADFVPANYIDGVDISFRVNADIKKDRIVKEKYKRLPSDLMA